MSEEQSNGSAEEVVQATPESKPVENKDEYVSKKAYEEMQRDMHKNKAGRKAEAARANELDARLKAIEEAKLVEEGKWKEAYEKVQKEKEEAERKANESIEKSHNLARRNALKSQLGNVRDEYLSHAKLAEIEIDEYGTPSSESVIAVANDFRQNHSALLPNSASTKITGQAPASTGVVPQGGEKSLSEMTLEQKYALLAEKKAERS